MKKMLPLFLLLCMHAVQCRKDHNAPPIVKLLHSQCANCEIDECHYNGQTIFCTAMMANDAGATLYNSNGEQIGLCNYAWGTVDTLCGQLENCQTLYRPENAMGLPPADKYGLDD